MNDPARRPNPRNEAEGAPGNLIPFRPQTVAEPAPATTNASFDPPMTAGEPAGFDDVFRRYLNPVYGFMYRHVGNRQDAEDLTSEVFLSASRNLDLSRPERAIGKWLFTVSRTVVADHWRRHYRLPPVVDMEDLQLAEFSPEPTSPGASAAKSQTVERVLGRLPDRYRQVLELRFLHGYTVGETAQELGMSIENVKVTQHRALAKAVQMVDEL